MTDPYHRTNINLHTADYEWLKAHYGHGWTEIVREWVRQQIKRERVQAQTSDRYLERLMKDQAT